MLTNQVKVRPLTPAIGAELSGVDLKKPLNDAQLDAIYDALIEYQVIFFQNQSISPINHLSFARSFGEPEGNHPIYPHVEGFKGIVLLKNNLDNPPDTDGWHTDVTFRQKPPFATILYAKKVPNCGGDTLWGSLSRAYETLPESMKSELDGMTAIHEMGDFRNNFSAGKMDGVEVTSAHQRFGSAIHPVIQRHPVSGRKILFVNEGFTQHLVGMRTTDSNKLLEYLYHHIDRPEYQVRFHWTEGAVAMWDNRCTCHYAIADYLPHERIMHRITVTDDARLERARTQCS